MISQKTIKLYVYVDGVNDAPFYGASYEDFVLANGETFVTEDGFVFNIVHTNEQAEIGSFRYEAKRMGGAPTISFSLMYESCLDDFWSENVYGLFNGEKYYLKHTPTSSYNNTSAMYKHDVELISERAALDNIYFFDVASKSIVEDDKPVSNSTKVVFFGNVSEFAQRLNASLEYSGLDYRVVVDDVVTSEEKLISFEDQFFSNVLQEIYNTYEVPYYFEGKTIHIGFSKLLSEGEELPVFSYGVDDALISITKNNANYKIVNRATGIGSSENIPYYYPNSAPKGEIEISTSGSLTNDDIKITDIEAFNRLYVDKEYTFKGDTSLNTVDERVIMPSLLQESPFVDGAAVVEKLYIEENSVGLEVRYNLFFDTETSTEIDLSWELSNPCNPAITMTPPLKNAYGKDQLEIKVEKVSIDSPSYKSDNYPCDIITDKHTYYESVTYRKGQTSTGKTNNKNIDTGIKISTPNLRGDVTVIVHLKFKTLGNFWDNVPDYFWGESSKKRPYSDILFYSSVDTMTTGGWQTEEGDSINMENYGIKFLRNPQYGDSFRYTIVKYVTPSNVLLPPKYRETDGKERFYNATNGTYEGVTFNNPFVAGKPREHIIKVEDIKPSIEGMLVNGQRIDMFEAFAYDLYDNDETYEGEDGNVYFRHPYFFAKLKPLGFNLFDHAIEQQPMTISFTSGACGACSFEIAVDEESQKNTVQVDDNGDIVYDKNGNVLCGSEEAEGQGEVTPQDIQQDTTDHSVWIALRKEESTYGILMPKAPIDSVGGHRPSTEDTFVILGIHLPDEYILNAEKRLEAEIIKYMQENNDEKFTFSINFSRIYFAENESVLERLNENSKIRITYNNKTYDLYVSSFSYSMSEGDVLPDIRVELDETLKISQNALQNAINEVKTTLGGAIDELSRNLLPDKKYLSKIKDDTALGTIDFRKGVKFGEGGKVEVLDNNSAKLTIEYLEVTKKATFTSLEIQEKTHVGGQMLVTPASMNCGEVEEFEGFYRCYFQTKGADGSEEIFNQFAVGDQAICQTFNAWGSKYYWRLVVGVGEDYIDLSKEDCDEGSGVPEAGDRIIQMGNRDNADRQNAIVIAAHGDNSPYIVQYKGINNFDLPKTDNDPRITTLLSPTKNVLTGQVKMVAGSSGLELFEEWAEKQELIDSKASGEDFDAFKNIVDKDIENIKKQVDGAITTWFYDPTPTLENAPAVDWATDEDKNNHLGDLYYSGAGKAYRFQYDEATTTYYWNLIEDEDITEALGLAQQAKDTADGKRRVFVVQPTPPYDEGDLWSRGSTLPMMVCVNTKTSGSFAEGDWDFADNTSQLATQIAGYEYIKEAIQNGSTIVTGGLIQSGVLMLGYTNANGQYQVMSGTNGIYNKNALGGGIAAWYGGVMEEGVANAIIRFDGSGYFAKGNLSWDNKGGASFADGKITITPQGALIFSDDIAFGSNENETVASIIQGLSTVLSYFTLDDAKTTLTSEYNLVIEGDVASGGDGQDTPGGSSGVSEEDVLDILEKNNYITSSALSSYYTKAESDARYLALSGGTITAPNKEEPLTLDSAMAQVRLLIQQTGSSKSTLGWHSSFGTWMYDHTTGCSLGIRDTNGTPFYYDTAFREIIHSGNVGSYAFVPKSDSLASNVNADNYLSNGVYLNQTGNGSGNSNFPQSYSIFATFAQSENYLAQLSIGYNSFYFRRKIDVWDEWREVIHSGNIGSQWVDVANSLTYRVIPSDLTTIGPKTINWCDWAQSTGQGIASYSYGIWTGSPDISYGFGFGADAFADELYFKLMRGGTVGPWRRVISTADDGYIYGLGGSIDIQYSDEINRYGGNLHLQHRGGVGATGSGTGGTTTGHILMCAYGGNVLIGTATDSGYKLDVTGDSRINGALRVQRLYDTNSYLDIVASDISVSYNAYDNSDGWCLQYFRCQDKTIMTLAADGANINGNLIVSGDVASA